MRTLSDLQGAVTQNSNLLHELLVIHRNQAQTNNTPSVIDAIAAKVEETNSYILAEIDRYNNPNKAPVAGSAAGGSGASAQGTIAQGSGSA